MAVQLMEVVYGVHDNGWLVKLLRGMIFGTGTGEKHKKVEFFLILQGGTCHIFPRILVLLPGTPNLIRACTPVDEDSENHLR